MARLNVNGVVRDFQAEDDTPLLWVLREQLGLTGTKYGCGIAQCGACTVHIDGVPTRSCVRPVSSVGANEKIVTIEGCRPMASHPVQKAWVALDVPQCGFCQSGMVMAAAALLKRQAAADRCRHRRGHHQHLPLRHLQPHPRRIKVVANGGGNTKTAGLAIQHTDGSTT
jgi:isoquinoline 1-oxidoreductase alpha subunit